VPGSSFGRPVGFVWELLKELDFEPLAELDHVILAENRFDCFQLLNGPRFSL
jgi:hypothetical protein